MPVAVIVDWFGPYKGLKAFRQAVRGNWRNDARALYMALGSYNIVRYIGLSESPVTRICNQHANLEEGDNSTFYIGEIVTQGISGPRRRKRPPDLRLAERTLIRYFQPELNTDFTETDPEDCVSIFSRFYDPDDLETPRYPLPKFPSLVAYNWWSREWFRG